MPVYLQIALPLVCLILGWTVRWLYARFQLSSSEQKSERLKRDAVKEAEALKRELVLETKDELLRERNQQEKDLRERRAEQQKFEKRLLQKEENLDKKLESVERQQQLFINRERKIAETEAELETAQGQLRTELERISGLTMDEAKKLIITELENEARHDACRGPDIGHEMLAVGLKGDGIVRSTGAQQNARHENVDERCGC